MAGAPHEEQRKRPRISRPFLVRYRPPSQAAERWFVSPLRDLSSGGARFLSEYPFSAGNAFEMQLLLPASKQPFLLRARVTWVKPGHLGLSEIGVTFDAGDVGFQQAIDQAVAHFLGREQRR